MSANADKPLAPGASILHFKLVQKCGGSTSVWKAEDSKSGRNVALKVLNRHLTRDPAKRESLIRDLRQAAALPHPSIVPIQEVLSSGDDLFLVMEWIDGVPLSSVVRRGLPTPEQCFRLAYELLDAMQFLHDRNMIHGNITGDTVLLTPAGRVRLVGFNLGNLGRKLPDAALARNMDSRAMVYTPPEQIAGKGIDNRSDIYSAGVVFYEMATGKPPFSGLSPEETARKVLTDQPASPKGINPAVDPAFVSLLGRCLHKDPYKRPAAAKPMLEDVRKSHPAVAAWARQTQTRLKATASPQQAPAPAPAAAPVTSNSVLWLAELANQDELAQQGPDAVTRAASKMQQILGEAVYLFDGEILDPFGPRMIAEMPDPPRALEALWRGAGELEEAKMPLKVRMLLHAGAISKSGGTISGPAIDQVAATFKALPPGKLVATGFFVAAAGADQTSQFRRVATRGGVDFFEVRPKAEPEPVTISAPAPPPVDPNSTVISTAKTVVSAPVEGAEPAPSRKGMPLWIPIAGAGALVAVIVAVWLIAFRGHGSAVGPGVAVERKVSAGPTAASPRAVAVRRFTVEGADPVVNARAEAVRLASLDVLRSYPELKVVEAAGAQGLAITGSVRTTPAGPELIPQTSGSRSGRPAPLTDAAAPMQTFVSWIRSEAGLPPLQLSQSPVALNSYADAVVSFASEGPSAKTESALAAAMQADPKFLPAQLLAVRVAQAKGDDLAASEAARRVLAIDPSRIDAVALVARSTAAAGDIRTSFGYWKIVLSKDPSNIEALNFLGRYAAAAGDEKRLEAILKRLSGSPNSSAVHEPDLLVAAGRMEEAVDKYYEIEVNEPRNVALALKIGRIAVLRHSLPIADLEMKKLQQFDPDNGAHLLAAYMAAQKGDPTTAAAELAAAKKMSKGGDDFYTSSAEIAAMTADNAGVISSLTTALGRREPTPTYVVSNPLFRYLASDPVFADLRAKFEAEKGEIAAALAQLDL
jgi:tRNA A-37 threonylcarbamoyl transferase component Bud32/tetratricopeptide (TPR) repeat protein